MTKVLKSIGRYFKRTNLPLWVVCIITSCYGAALVYSATRTGGTGQFKTQVMAIAIGYVGAIVISLFDYKSIAKLWPLIAVFCIGLMALTSVFGITVAGTDDKAWIRIGGISFQPSELVKIGFIVTLAKHLDVLREKEKLKSFWQIMLLFCHAAIPMGIIHLQGDDGAVLVFLFIFLAMCFGAGVQLRYFAAFFGAVAVAAPLAWKYVLNNDQKTRFKILLDHSADPQGYGYQQGQGEISIGSGMFSGRGYLQGPRVTAGIVPEDHNDFIYTVAGEEFGFIGCVAIMVLLASILGLTLYIAARARDPLGKYICYGFFGMIALQAVENIGMCLYVLPVVGITLPFFSAGGSSAACLYFGIGLVQCVYANRNNKITVGMLAEND